MAEEGEKREEHPRSLEELLKISLKLSDDEMKDWKSTYNAMSDDRKDWLQEAMDHAMKNDEVELMISSLKLLRDSLTGSEPVPVEEQTIALEQLVCLCDTIDMAKNLHKVGGFDVLLPLLQHENSELRWRSSEVIAAAVQNNPFCQAACHDLKALPVLFHLLKTDHVVMVQVKALYALSRLVNNFDKNEDEFLSLGGFPLLCQLLSSDHVKLKTKSAFMLRDHLLKSSANLEDLLSAGIMMTLEVQLSVDADESLEHLVKLLYEIISMSQPASRKDLLTDGLLTAIHLKREWMAADAIKYEEEIECVNKIDAMKC